MDIDQEILILGDSHAAVFNEPAIHLAFPGYFFSVISVGGATVSGLKNPNSKSQALSTFMDNADSSHANTAIVLLGEVDTGFVIFYRAEKYEIAVSEAFNKALHNYQDLISHLAKKRRVICMSTPLPTIKDDQDWGEVANARRYVKTSQLERTRLTLAFNQGMQEFCEKIHCDYLDFDHESLGSNGLVHPKLLNPCSLNHHYNPHAYAEMIIPKLKQLIKPSYLPGGETTLSSCHQ